MGTKEECKTEGRKEVKVGEKRMLKEKEKRQNWNDIKKWRII